MLLITLVIKCHVAIIITQGNVFKMVPPIEFPVHLLEFQLSSSVSWIWLKGKDTNIQIVTFYSKMFVKHGTTFRFWVLLWFEQKSTMHTDIGPQVKEYMITSISKSFESSVWEPCLVEHNFW